jgi:hypothetical protein
VGVHKKIAYFVKEKVVDISIKSPAERFPVGFNFSPDLITGETIIAKTVTCVSAATGVSSAATIIDSEAIVDSDVAVVLKAGTEGDEHNIQCAVFTSKGNRYQRDLLLMIQTVVTDFFYKQPDDAFSFGLNFSRRLEVGDTLASVVGVATKEADGSDVSGTMIPFTEIISPKVGVRVAVGLDGETYLLAIRGTSTAGYVYEKIFRMNVQERP